MKTQPLIWGFFLCCTLSACSSLKEINDYSKVSIQSLNTCNALQYNYATYCRRNCALNTMRNLRMDTAVQCNCMPPAKRADSTLLQIHAVLTGYLEAIEKLSDNNLYHYDVSGLSNALQANPMLRITDQQKDIITKSGNFLATISTASYRRKSLRKYITQADTIFAALTETYIYLIEDRLTNQLKTDYAMHAANLNQLYDNAGNNDGLKQFIVRDLMHEKQYYAEQSERINRYIQLIQLIKDGHHQLFLEKDRLRDSNCINLIKRYTAEIQQLMATVKQ